jgi:hypothetical protein
MYRTYTESGDGRPSGIALVSSLTFKPSSQLLASERLTDRTSVIQLHILSYCRLPINYDQLTTAAYHTVWCSHQRCNVVTGLSVLDSTGVGPYSLYLLVHSFDLPMKARLYCFLWFTHQLASASRPTFNWTNGWFLTCCYRYKLPFNHQEHIKTLLLRPILL